MSVKIAVAPPIPKASVSTAGAVNARDVQNCLAAFRTEAIKRFMRIARVSGVCAAGQAAPISPGSARVTVRSRTIGSLPMHFVKRECAVVGTGEISLVCPRFPASPSASSLHPIGG
jgi:hypothetical protein